VPFYNVQRYANTIYYSIFSLFDAPLGQPKKCVWMRYRDTFAFEDYTCLFKDLLQALADRWGPKLQLDKRAGKLSDSEGEDEDDNDE
jgi:hypothetical protein